MALSQLLVLMIGAIAVSIFAERQDIQPPLLLALIGLAASFIPGFQRIELEPQVILAVVLPPLLFSAASEFSFFSFIRQLGSIANLGVFLVLVTTGVVGLVAYVLLPALSLPGAMVLAAVVSPPDAVTAVTIGRKLGLPERVMTVIKGESLINDAAALTLFAFATASVTGAHLLISNLALYLLYSAVAGIAVGVVVGAVVHATRRRLNNPSLTTALTVLVPFTAYLVAEEIGASAVLAVVAAGFSLGHNSSSSQFDARLQERNFWHTIDSLLETFVFGYIGLQFRFVAEDAGRSGMGFWPLAGIALLVLLAVIAVRLAWVFLTGAIARWRYPRLSARRAGLPPDDRRLRRDLNAPFRWRENLVIGWTGMRGVVTLAAAAGIPFVTQGDVAFPGRDVAVVVAFVVTIGTLLLQGLTLPLLIRALGISDPEDAKRRKTQARLAQKLMRDASLAMLAAYGKAHPEPEAQAITRRMTERMQQANAFESETAEPERNTAMLSLIKEILTARRLALVQARDERRIDDDVMREELEQMDLEEAVVANWTPERFGR